MAQKVAIVGSGNWGSVIARIVAENLVKYPDLFHGTLNIHVYEEMVNGRKLTEIINTDHENVKYLPGYKFPTNIVAIPDIVEACGDADIIIFVLPHKFVRHTLKPLEGKLKPNVIGVSLIKGFDINPGQSLCLISNVISDILKIPCAVLMGANLANEVAAEKFCEATLGAKSKDHAKVLKKLVETNYFRIVTTDDVSTIEVCGAIKNIVACGAGFVDGLDYGDNTKAAVIRLGLKEMIAFANQFYPGAKLETFFESCGVADLVTTCYGGRNRKVSEAFVRADGKKTLECLEKEMLNGQKLQGPETAAEVYEMLKQKNQLERFPLFVAIHKICIGQLEPKEMINCIRNHPEHM